MLVAVDFISKAAFERIHPAQDLAVLSIGNPAELPPDAFYAYENALRMEFLDCDRAGLEKWGFPEEALCTVEQMNEMLEYLERLHQAAEPLRLVVHCHMGASRSAAVALIAHAVTGCEFPRQAEANFANTHILELAQTARDIQVTAPPTPGPDYVYLPSGLAV